VDPVNGNIISDHTIASASSSTCRTCTGDTESVGRDPSRVVYPPELFQALQPLLGRRLPTDNDHNLFAAIEDTFSQDNEVVGMSLRARKAFEPRLELSYLKGVDILSHYLWGFFRPGDVPEDIEMPAGHTGWLPAQQHSGANIGDSDTHVLFVELKEGSADGTATRLGPE
jgi:hypothetical protein